MLGLGSLILVVGPSGVGKDTLLAGAAEALAGAGRFHFARRAVTRAAGAGGEDHIAVTEAAFLATEAAGGYLLSWQAHGLCYGVPREPAQALRAAGVAIVANVSRAAVDAARARLQPVRIVAVDAGRAALAARLAGRGREDAAAVAARLARADALHVAGPDVFTVANDADIASGVRLMVAALEAASTAERQPAE